MLKRHISLIIFLLSTFIFVLGTNQFDFGNEESRFILFAQEMLRHGITPFPLLQGKFYPDYPATATIFIYLFSLLAGKVTPLTSVLPSAIAAALVLMFTYKIAALYSQRWGIYAVFIALMTYTFLLLARLPSPDPFLAVVTTIAFYDVYQRKSILNKITLGWTPCLLVLGFCLRGPMGLIIPAIVVGCFYVVEREWRWFFITGFYSVVLLVVATFFELKIAQQVGGEQFVQDVFRMQVGGRLENLGQRPFYYYFTSGVLGYALAFPLAIICVFTQRAEIFCRTVQGEKKLLQHLVLWVLVILILLSFPREKHFRYVLSTTPALALLAGYLWIMPTTSLLVNLVKNTVKWLCWLLPVIGLIVIFVVPHLKFFKELNTTFSIWPALLFFAISLIILLLMSKKKILDDKDVYILMAGVLAYLTFFIAVAQPIANAYITSVRPLFLQIQKLRVANEPLVFFSDDKDRDNLKFLVLLDQKEPPLYLQTVGELNNFNQPAILLADQRVYMTIPEASRKDYSILLQTKQARRNWVVFKKNLKFT